ncbi:DUF4422 domain-containing protein [Pelagibacteraceae bacterium]|nr:DUF4422 domain-containing protein [Pelagibacteraceae bacterium]
MKKIEIYCMTIKNLNLLNKLPKNIIPLGLGEEIYPNNWLNEKEGENISHLNKYFGEATGIYWIWKNKIREYSANDWIGTCQHRRLWLNDLLNKKQKTSYLSLFSQLIKNENNIFDNCESVLLQPTLFKKDTVQEQFQKNYGSEVLEDCINLLDIKHRKDFSNYLQGYKMSICNMFITKPEIYEKYCIDMFDWIFKCFNYCQEKNLQTGKNMRLPIFLIERFTSFWYEKHTKVSYLSFARLGNFFLSNRVNKLINPLKVPFTFRIYPTIHKF